MEEVGRVAVVYIINEALIYDAQAHLLHYMCDDKTVTLPIPASNCFKILLDNHGEIISQETLLTRVWNARGMNVNANTLHQNISLLRKALSQIENGRSVIKTIPKRGFTIPTDVTIQQKIQDEESDPPGNEMAEVAAPPGVMTAVPIEKGVFLRRKGIRSFIAAGALLLPLVVVLWHIITPPRNYFSAYIEINDSEECKVFVNNIPDDSVIFQSLIKRSAVDCGARRWVYITGNHVADYPSFIACRNQPGTGLSPGCQSFYFFY